MINVFGASLGEEELNEVRSCLNNAWIGSGNKVKEFEDKLAARLSLPGLVMVDSGSNAIYLCVRLLEHLGLSPGAKIIVPSFTFVSCATSVLLSGHPIVFADVDLHTQNITPETISAVRTKETQAVLAVHYAGLPIDITALRNMGLFVIEDAAHAVDSKINGRYCGSMGEVGMYSFDPIKNIATPESGGITAENPKLLDLAREYRYSGIGESGFNSTDKERWWEYDIKHLWIKMMPNDIAAGIGLAQLRKLDFLQRRRKEIWNRYQKELNISWLVLPSEATEQHSYFTYFVRVLNGKRDALAKYLLDNKVYTTLRYHPLHLNAIYSKNVELPVCELLNKQGLNLPLHPALTDDNVTKVIDLIRGFPS